MKGLAFVLLSATALLCTSCFSQRNIAYYEPPSEYYPTQSMLVVEPTPPPTESMEFRTIDPVSPDPGVSTTPSFMLPLEAIKLGLADKYGGTGTEQLALKGFNVWLGEEWLDEPDEGDENEKIIDGPYRYKTDDGANLIVYVQDNTSGWDASDEELNNNVVNAMMQSDPSYLLLESATLDTPLGKGLLIYYKLINDGDDVHNQRACLVMVPVDNKVLAVSAGAYESNESEVFTRAFTAIGRVLGSAESEYI